jgi:hypothetical protein
MLSTNYTFVPIKQTYEKNYFIGNYVNWISIYRTSTRHLKKNAGLRFGSNNGFGELTLKSIGKQQQIRT